MDGAPATAVPGWAVWSLRGLVLAVTLLVLAQPVLAGLFVTGDVGMLGLHGAIASFLAALVFFQVVAAILVWRPGRGPAWPIGASVAGFVLVEAQSAAGYARAVALHIPLGVLLFGLSVALLIAVWSPGVRRRRPRRGAER
ncbi:hypothetical protein D5H75_01790 [Bailinhaonella thermotolerans]|uniref:Uncharacterized protein n=1 Tax=Bailinhaonella thermotolerans TaxID=1070861 RepID=A0A3A4BB90_9ACTN|nr:hypothetical protein D5H75_01790 [Bailinhaonella thermotolerans]